MKSFNNHFPANFSINNTSSLLNSLSGDEQIKEPSDLFQFVAFDGVDGKHFCQICKKFSHKSRSNARNHVEAVHYANLFAYSCQICGQTVGSKNALNIHMTRMHKKS